MLNAIGKFLMDYVLGKAIFYGKKLLKKLGISKEVDAEVDAMEKAKQKAINFYKENPDAKELPKNIKDELERAARLRSRGL